MAGGQIDDPGVVSAGLKEAQEIARMKRRCLIVDERMQVDKVRFHDGAIDVDAVLARVIDERKGRHSPGLDTENVTHPFGAGEAQACRADESGKNLEVEFA